MTTSVAEAGTKSGPDGRLLFFRMTLPALASPLLPPHVFPTDVLPIDVVPAEISPPPEIQSPLAVAGPGRVTVPANDRTRPSPSSIVRTVSVGTVLAAAVIALVVWQRHRLSDLPRVLADANWIWIVAAIAFQAISVGSLARLQRRLLNVDGRHHPFGPILATTYAGNAISVSLPIVGSTASAVFAYKRFLHIGAEKATAAWALAVAGLYSTITFVTISAVGALLTGSVGLALAGFVTLFAGVVPVITLLAGLHNPRVRPLVVRLVTRFLTIGQRVIGKPTGDPGSIAASAIDQVAALRLGLRNAFMAARFAFLNWTADIACLACVLAAVGAPIPWHGLILAWAAAAGASSMGLTPGGLGVVEAALSVALIAAGLPAGIAVSAVLLYRFIKLWLVLFAGAITLLVIRAKGRRTAELAERSLARTAA